MLLMAEQSLAGGFSYVYIQGDKSTPFYVKLEDQMLPRYGKNYNLIPQLAPGTINIEILFQQNAYPAQKFTIIVPENGFRGFLLLKKNGVYSLYDIHQQFYLHAGNKAADDQAPAANTAAAYVNTTPNIINNSGSEYTTSQPAKRTRGVSPKFLPNVELSSERTVQYEAPVANEHVIEEEEYPQTNYSAPNNSRANVSVVRNSDCPSAMSSEEFDDLLDKTRSKAEKVKLKFLLSKMEDCYTADQARILAESLGNDPERYTLLKRIYSRVSDQHNFPMLERLLSTQEWKSYFKLILPN